MGNSRKLKASIPAHGSERIEEVPIKEAYVRNMEKAYRKGLEGNKSTNNKQLKMSINRCILDSMKNVETEKGIKIPMKPSIAKRLGGSIFTLVTRRIYVE